MSISYSLAGKIVVYIKSEHIFTFDAPGSLHSWVNFTEDSMANMFDQVNLHGLEKPGLFLEIYPNPQNTCSTLAECQQIRLTFIFKSRELAENICKNLTYKFCELFTVDRVVESDLRYEQRDENGRVTPSYVAEFGFASSIDCTVTKKFTASDVKDLERLSSISAKKLTRISIFYEALRMTDPVATYMVLYGLGLNLCGDKQCSFDKFIESRKGLQEDRCKSQYQSGKHTSNSGKRAVKTTKETWYTYVRNRLAHFKSEPPTETQEQSTSPPTPSPENCYNLLGIDKITQEMSKILPDLIQIVRELIDEKEKE